ncbi:magnesium chelatase subunit D [Palleronia sp. KMU-117]|uniref:magnesium chelatase subunit D n=1 Tax=Palleronia sp. KMU-117 TaxID=3434108 RepID=UPI003D71B752
MTGASASAAWDRACTAVAVLAVDPLALGGLWLRARSGPVREALLDRLDALPLPRRRIQPMVSDSQLFGGVDLSATLAAGRVVHERGLLATPAVLVLAMAERSPSGLPARLGQALDDRRCALVALDEGAEADEMLPTALQERLGLFVCLDDLPVAVIDASRRWTDADITSARDRLRSVTVSAENADELVILAATLGIGSLRAPLFAVRVARALAALNGRAAPSRDDLAQAADLVFAHRALAFPDRDEAEVAPEADQADPDTPDDSHDDSDRSRDPALPDDILLDAVRVALPPDLLAQLAGNRARVRGGTGSGSGSRKRGNRRGRPLPSRPGHPDGRSRIDIVATLRAAAPWQPMRRAASPHGHLLHIRPADIRLRRFEDRSDRLLIFAVDASGSSAMARLAEAKGAVELLLAEAYARRDHVALVAFRGAAAELLLPPTRSLVQTKRRLTALPGGGGTPLAAGLRAAQETAIHARRHGLTPSLVLLTDGRGNVALDGRADRAQAGEDAEAVARSIRGLGMSSLVVDTANRPQEALRALSGTLGGTYLALPRASAERLSKAVSSALDG